MYQELQRIVSEAKALLAVLAEAAEDAATAAQVKASGLEESGL